MTPINRKPRAAARSLLPLYQESVLARYDGGRARCDPGRLGRLPERVLAGLELRTIMRRAFARWFSQQDLGLAVIDATSGQMTVGVRRR
jgi:hypothetical protein